MSEDLSLPGFRRRFIAKRGKHVVEMRSPRYPGCFVPLTAEGAEYMKDLAKRRGEQSLFADWSFKEHDPEVVVQ